MKRLAERVPLAWGVMMVLAAAPALVTGAEFIHFSGGMEPPSTYAGFLGVSGDGRTAVGYSMNDPMSLQALRWTPDGGLTPLPGLADAYGRAFGISADGSVIVGQAHGSAGYEAARWTAGGVESIGSLWPSGGGSAATAASGDGSVIVGASDSRNAVWGLQGFVWTSASGMRGLPFYSGGYLSETLSISDDGLRAAGYIEGYNGVQGVIWDVGGEEAVHGLGWLDDGGEFSVATRISGDGKVAIGQSDTTGGWAAVRWTDDGIEDLGTLARGPGMANAATAVNWDGSVVAGYYSAVGAGGAFIWDEEHGIRDLKVVLENDYGLDLSGWSLGDVFDMSADGSVLVGAGINPAGSPEAWIAIIPEPGAGLLIVLAFGLVPRRR